MWRKAGDERTGGRRSRLCTHPLLIDAKEGGDAIVHKLCLVAHCVAVKGRELTAKVHRVVIELVSQAMLSKIQINAPGKTKEEGCGPAQRSAQRHYQASGPDARVSNTSERAKDGVPAHSFLRCQE